MRTRASPLPPHGGTVSHSARKVNPFARPRPSGYNGTPVTGLQIGELAAVGAAVLWTLSTLAWTSSGRRIGALAVSFHRLMITCVFLLLHGGLARGCWLPTDADGRTWLILGLSGLTGFSFATCAPSRPC